MSAATEDDLGKLHGAVARGLTDIVTDGETVVVGKGEDAKAVKIAASAAYYAAAITLLKNNNITAGKGNAALNELKQALAAKQRAKTPAFTQKSLEEAAELFGQQHSMQ